MKTIESMVQNLLSENLNVFQSIENFEYRLDDWKNGKVRLLFVLGLSGSGKSTIARQLSLENGSKLLTLDGYFKQMLRQRYSGSFKNDEEYHASAFKNGVSGIIADYPAGKIVVDGGQICWLNPEELREHSVIVVGTSFIASTWRAILRDFTREHWEQYGHFAPHVHTSFNLRTFEPIKKVIAALSKDCAE